LKIATESGDQTALALHEAITAFRTAMANYNKSVPEDDDGAREFAAATYGRPLKIIEAWQHPAESLEEAIAALRLADDADRDGDYSIVGPMLRAALAFFECKP
jgi:hypothetical protein